MLAEAVMLASGLKDDYRQNMCQSLRPIPGIKSRVRRYEFIKYKEFDWRSLAARALKGIVVGPSADHERAGQFAKDCLLLSHAETVPITCSAIPYRAV
jgi:hypothetical protein